MSDNNIEISVIMPCYNVEKYINEGIESVLNQTFTDFELIIIDDGSTDQTWSICNNYKDSRIKLHKLKTNKGNYFARNLGLMYSKGNFIAMLDADDSSHPKRLEIQH